MEKESLLCEITGDGLKKPSYLYGTIHIQDKRVFSFDETVLENFERCDAYAMEVITDEIDENSIQKVFLMKRNTLKKLLDEVSYKKLKTIVEEKFHIPISAYENTKPMFVTSQLIQYYEQKDMSEALDIYFLNMARQQNKLVFGLEKVSEQLNAVHKISLKDQCMLIDVIKDPEEIEKKYDELLEAYLKPDFKKILKLTTEKSLPHNFNDVFLIQRNRRMARRIENYIKKNSTFNALGAGHLVGKGGVINLLAERGFDIRPINFRFNN